MIAFRNFFKTRDKRLPPMRLPRPAEFVLVRGADHEGIDAIYDRSGRKMIRLIVHTKTRPPIANRARRS